MASNLKRSKRTVGKRIDDLHRRVLHMQKRPAPRRIGSRVVVSGNLAQDAVTPVELAPDSVTQDAIAPGAVTNTELAPGAGGADTTYSGTAPTSPSIGDVWFDSSDSLKLKRWDGTAWVSMRDLGIAAAAAGAAAADAAATAAQTTANGKNKVFYTASAPTAVSVGDLWFDTDEDNKLSKWSGSAWEAFGLGDAAFSNINAGKITAGTIAAARITSTSISAADINADRITAGTIAAARITSASIAAADINADRITAGRILAGDTEIGNNVGPGDGHHGISLSPNNFNNIFIRRASDGVYFFRVNEGGANSLTFDSSSGVLNVTGTINASAGTIGGWAITSNLLQGQAGTNTRIQLLKSVPANLTYYGNASYHNLPAMCIFDNLNAKAIGYFGSYSDNIVSMEGITGSTYIEIDSDGADGITIYADTNSLSGAAGIHLGSSAQNVWFDSYTHSGSPVQYLRILADGRATLGTPSDISLKQNINTAPSVIEKVKQLNIVNFYWKDKYNYGSAEQIGLIAQELEQVFPSFVGLDHSTNKKNISTEPLLFVCIKAIQELCDKIDFLELKLENG